MKCIRVLLALSLVVLAAPLFAQGRSFEITGWYSQVDPQGDPDPDLSNLRDIEFDGDSGWGLGVNVFWGSRLSTEFAGYVVSPSVATAGANPAIAPFAFGDLEMIPLTATLQFHLLPNSRIDPYVGAGVGYVLFDQVDRASDVTGINVDAIDFDDDFGYVLNGGVSVGLTRNLALNVEAKYMPLESSANVVFAGTTPAQQIDIEVNPMIVSAGLSLRF
jgi:outer membrane protein W